MAIESLDLTTVEPFIIFSMANQGCVHFGMQWWPSGHSRKGMSAE